MISPRTFFEACSIHISRHYPRARVLVMMMLAFVWACTPALAQDGVSDDLKEREADVVAYRIDEAPEIDGDLDDESWLLTAEKSRSVMSGWRTGVPESSGSLGTLAEQQRVAYVAYDDEALYIAMQAFVYDLDALRVDPSGNPFLGDCLEVHINVPDHSYFQFGIDWQANFSAPLTPAQTDTALVEYEAGLGDNFWTVEMRIPWSVLGVIPEHGYRMGFTLSANHATQHPGPDVTRLRWGRAFTVRQNEVVLELR